MTNILLMFEKDQKQINYSGKKYMELITESKLIYVHIKHICFENPQKLKIKIMSNNRENTSVSDERKESDVLCFLH